MPTPRRARTVLTLIALASLVVPAVGRTQSPQPGPPDAWSVAVCTAHDRVGRAREALAALGQSALAGDPDGVGVAAITAGLLGDEALRALETVSEAWDPGTPAAGYLAAAAFALVDVGVALAETDLLDPDALRTALGNTIGALDGVERATAELEALRASHALDCATLPIPTPEPQPTVPPPTAEPTFLGDAELMGRFPTTIAGEQVDPVSRAGAELIASQDLTDPETADRLDDLLEFLAAAGHDIDDVSLGFAFVPTPDGSGASITAFRVRGGDAAALVDGLLPLITVDYADVIRDTVTVAGRDYPRVSDGPYDPSGIHEVLVPIGDTVWAVSALDPVLTEIVTALPG